MPRKQAKTLIFDATYGGAKALTFERCALSSATTIEKINRPPSRALSSFVRRGLRPGRSRFRGYMPLSHLGLSAKVLAAVIKVSYTSPTPHTDQAIPLLLSR